MATQNGDLQVLKPRRSMSIGSGLAALQFLNEGASVEIAVNASSTARSECDLPMPGERDMSCTCAGRGGGKPCDGKCQDSWLGFARLLQGKGPCLDLEGHVLPQTVHELHRMVRVIQRQQQQQADQAAKKLRQVEFDSSQQLQSWIEALRTADRQLEKLQRQVKQLQTEKEELAVKVAAVEGQLEKAQPPPSVDDPSVDNDGCDASSICSEDVPQLGLAAATSIGSSINQTAVPQGSGELVEPSPLLAAAVEQLTGAVEQLAEVLVKGSNRRYPLVQRLLLSAKTGAAGCNLVSSWDKEACQAALHSHILRLAVTSSQQALPWPQTPLDASLASSPEAGRTNLQAAMRQLQQAKSSTLFLVAQQQAPSHPAAREVAGFVTSVKEHMLQRLEQQLGLDKDLQAGEVWRPQLLAVASAAAGVQLLVSGLQGSCPGLQLVISLEDWAAPEGQRACEAPVRQLLGKVQSSRPLFLVRPGLVCPAAGGGRQVLVRQQLVELVPDQAWQEQQRQQVAEEAEQREQQEQQVQQVQQPPFCESLVECDEPKPPALPGATQSGADLARSKAPAGCTAASVPFTTSDCSSSVCVQQLTSASTSSACYMDDSSSSSSNSSSSSRGMSVAAEQQLAASLDSVGREVQMLVDDMVLGGSPLPEVVQHLCHPAFISKGDHKHCWLPCHVFMLDMAMKHMQPEHAKAHTAISLTGTGPSAARVEEGQGARQGMGVEAGEGSSPSGSPGGSHAALNSATAALQQHLAEQLGLGPRDRSCWEPQLLTVAAAIAATQLLLEDLQSSWPDSQLDSMLGDWHASKVQKARATLSFVRT